MWVYPFGLCLCVCVMSRLRKVVIHTNNVQVTATAWMYDCIKFNLQKSVWMCFMWLDLCSNFRSSFGRKLFLSTLPFWVCICFHYPHVFFKWATLKLAYKNTYLLYILHKNLHYFHFFCWISWEQMAQK